VRKVNIIKKLEQESGWMFKELSLEDIHIYTAFIKKSSIPTNEWTTAFPYLWATSTYLTLLWSIIDNMLVTFRYSNSKKTINLQCVPLGEGNPDHVVNVLYTGLKFCDRWNKKSGSEAMVSILNEAQLDFLKRSDHFDQQFKYSFHRTKGRNVLERHYSLKKLISLSGRDLSYVRSAINKLQRDLPNLMIRHYQPNDYEKLILLYKEWFMTVEDKYYYISDKAEYRQILKHYIELNQIVLIAELDGQIIGMISGGEHPNGQSWISFRKTIYSGRGLTQALVVKLAEEIHQINPMIELLNDGTDDGQEGLIFVKEKFRPVLNLTLHSLYLK
jgi:uncharacterized protein